MKAFFSAIGNFIEKSMGTIIPLGILTIAIGGLGGMFYGIDHADDAFRMHREHDQFVLRQEICIVHEGWYVPEEEYHGLLACRSLDDHSLFYVVEATGLEVYPSVPIGEDDGEEIQPSTDVE